MPAGLIAERLTKKYKPFLPAKSKILNYSSKATGRDCDICGHTPEARAPKPGYPTVSEEMRLMRVQLPAGTTAKDVNMGRSDFTVTGQLIEINVCEDSQACRERAGTVMKEDGVTPKYDPKALAFFR